MDSNLFKSALDKVTRLTVTRKITLKDAAYAYMPTGYLKASAQGTLPAHVRQVMYASRGFIQSKTGETLDDDYFTQNLLPSYLKDYPEQTRDWDVVFDARGHLVEPHTGRKVALGTLPVRNYLAGETARRGENPTCIFPTIGPKHRFETILFIEKEGFLPLFENVNLAERFDLAIMSTKGMSTTAARELVDQLVGARQVKLLILRDFDKAGFSIASTLQSDTWRYAFAHQIDAVDLGLRLSDVKKCNLESEDVTYGKTDPRPNLRSNGATEAEIEFLCEDSDWRGYCGKRVELNAFASDALIAWIEAKLEDREIKKLVPTDDILEKCYREEYERQFLRRELDDLRETHEEHFAGVEVPENLKDRVEAALKKAPKQAWDNAIADLVESFLDEEAAP